MKVIIGLYNQLQDRSIDFQKQMRAISIHNACILLAYKESEIVEGNSIDSIVSSSYEKKADWLFLMSYGLIVKHANLIQLYLNNANRTGGKLFGHILKDKPPNNDFGYFSLHQQNFFLHLPTWKKIGSPKFGMTGISKTTLTVPSVSESNFHDDYTPHFLTPTDKTKYVDTFLIAGWRLISSFLENKYQVENFNSTLREFKQYLYPEQDSNFEKFLNDRKHPLVNINQKEIASQICLDIYNSFFRDFVGLEIRRGDNHSLLI